MAKSSTSDRALGLPELLAQIAVHLSPPSLAVCARVSHHWNDNFTPPLWHTIDDSLYFWPTLLHLYEHLDQVRQIRRVQDRIRHGLQKYGHHIRHLSVTNEDFAKVVSQDGASLRLESLSIVWSTRSFNWTDGLDMLTPDTLAVEKEAVAVVEKGGILHPDAAFNWNFTKDDWVLIQKFWLLVFRVPGLRSFKFFVPEHRELLKVITPQFFRGPLAAQFRTLTSVQLDFEQLDLLDFLETLPNLQHLYTGYDSIKDGTLKKVYPRLRTLVIDQTLSGTTFYNLLKHLPGLEHFGVGSVLKILEHENCYGYNNNNENDGIPVQLRGLHLLDEFDEFDYDTMADIAYDILPGLPFLTELTIDAVYPSLGFVLVTYCRQLEVFRCSENIDSIHCDGINERRGINVMSDLLESCPRLRVFDAITHEIIPNRIIRNPWVCKNLEVFRCQLTGFSRLDSDEELVYKGVVQAMESTRDMILSEEQDEICDQHQRCQTQHHQVYDRLASLTELRILDLGHQLINPEHRNNSDPYVESLNRESHAGRTYIHDNGPIFGSMELSLPSGLARLRTLKKLEVFGFTGVDHRIREPELEWMAKAWPHLEVMRGLCEGQILGAVDCYVTSALRRKMQKLRPDVRHENFEPEGSTSVCLRRLF
ncbi:hypothetical protein EC957_011220 [Mortierella hygrophila]|uniref:F-box domain-containing protein n=1 Tax=Mortierella hygrophila TaxID=979708 RepID=A0A9P6F8W5_9FUNG|nr:hypothetical protein EC957_011220 [Mortierella hygrophila]